MPRYDRKSSVRENDDFKLPSVGRMWHGRTTDKLPKDAGYARPLSVIRLAKHKRSDPGAAPRKRREPLA
jgi:hypothetical protein